MNRSARKLLTIVAESGLENRLVTLLHNAGARGYTVSASHGEGARNQRAGDISGGNIRIESVITEDIVNSVVEQLERDYFPHYAVTLWIADVVVIRSEKF